MKKSMCDGPGCGKRMMDSPQARFGSKKGPGGCKCGGKCAKCKEKAESEESEADEPDGDRDDSYSRAVIVTDSMSGYRRFDSPTCGSGTKPCGKICIDKNYNCEIQEAASKHSSAGNRNRTIGALGGLAAAASTAGLIGSHSDLGVSGGARAALLGTALLGGGAALGLGLRARHNRKVVGSAWLAQAENEPNKENRGRMRMVGEAMGGTPEMARSRGWMKGSGAPNRKDSIWASGFENVSSESL